MSNKLVIASLIAGLTFGSQIVSAQDECWTTAGSTGTVDEGDLGEVVLSSNTAMVNSAVSNGIVDIFYNVVAVDGVVAGNEKRLKVRFADNGEAAHVTVSLRRLNISNGVITTLAELDSNDYAPSTVAQTQSIACPPRFSLSAGHFNFENNIYYIVGSLIKTGTGGNPLTRAIQICQRLALTDNITHPEV